MKLDRQADSIIQGLTDYDKEFECCFKCNDKSLEIEEKGGVKGT